MTYDVDFSKLSTKLEPAFAVPGHAGTIKLPLLTRRYLPDFCLQLLCAASGHK